MSTSTLPHATGGARRAAEPLGWWTALLAAHLGLVPAISATELAVGAAAAAAAAALAAAVAVAARLHALHSGHVGDYAAWLTAGVAVLALLTLPW